MLCRFQRGRSKQIHASGKVGVRPRIGLDLCRSFVTKCNDCDGTRRSITRITQSNPIIRSFYNCPTRRQSQLITRTTGITSKSLHSTTLRARIYSSHPTLIQLQLQLEGRSVKFNANIRSLSSSSSSTNPTSTLTELDANDDEAKKVVSTTDVRAIINSTAAVSPDDHKSAVNDVFVDSVKETNVEINTNPGHQIESVPIGQTSYMHEGMVDTTKSITVDDTIIPNVEPLVTTTTTTTTTDTDLTTNGIENEYKDHVMLATITTDGDLTSKDIENRSSDNDTSIATPKDNDLSTKAIETHYQDYDIHAAVSLLENESINSSIKCTTASVESVDCSNGSNSPITQDTTDRLNDTYLDSSAASAISEIDSLPSKDDAMEMITMTKSTTTTEHEEERSRAIPSKVTTRASPSTEKIKIKPSVLHPKKPSNMILKPKASNPTRYQGDVVSTKFDLNNRNGHNITPPPANDEIEVSNENNKSNTTTLPTKKFHGKSKTFLNKSIRDILSKDAMGKNYSPPSPFVESKLLSDHLISQGEVNVPISTWVHVEGISPISSLESMLTSVQKALDVEEANGIYDLDAWWNEKLPLPTINYVDPTKITDEESIFMSWNDIGDNVKKPQHKWVRKAKLVISPFARPTGWYLQFDNRSIVYALLRHAQEHTVRCTWRFVYLKEYRNSIKDNQSENEHSDHDLHDPISNGNYIVNEDISDSTLRVENCPPNIKEASILNFFSRYDLQSSVGKNGGKPIQLWSGVTTDGRATSPTTYLVHFADSSWARAALRDKQNTYMFQLGSPIMDYKNPKPLHIVQYTKQLL